MAQKLAAEKVKIGSTNSGRRVDNTGPILMSPGGTFNISSLNNGPTRNSLHSPSRHPSPNAKPPQEIAANQESNLNNQLILRELFGGAMSIKIPGSFQDVSTIREVFKLATIFLVYYP